MTIEEEIGHAVRDGIREGIKSRLNATYQNPLDKLIAASIESRSAELRGVLDAAISASIGDGDFRSEVSAAVRERLAKLLVQRFGGELEKQVNALKSDPTTRARITLAVEQLVAQR